MPSRCLQRLAFRLSFSCLTCLTCFMGLACFMCFMCLAASPAAAGAITRGSATAAVLTLDTVEVHGARPDEAARRLRAPGFVSVLAVDASRGAADGLAGVLESAPGLHVSTSGGPGGFATLSIRGSPSTQVGWFLDGVPLRWNEFGAVNLNDLPFESLQRVEVFRGNVPVELGTAGAAGAVNLVSHTSAGAAARLAATAGSFGERQLSAGTSLRGVGGWSVHATLSRLEYGGAFRYLDNHGTPFNTADDRIAERRNNDLTRWNGSLLIRRGRLFAGVYQVAGDQGLPGLDYTQATRARFQSSGSVAHLFWRAAGGAPGSGAAGARAGGSGLELEAFYTRGSERFRDLLGELKLGQIDSRSVDRNLGAQARAHLSLGRAWRADAFLQQRVEHWSPELLNRPDLRPRGGNRSAGVSHLRLGLGEGPIQLQAAARAEWLSDRGASIGLPGRPSVALSGQMQSRVLPSVATSLRLFPGGWLKADAGAYQRPPSLAERFGIEGSRVGNPLLRPERGENYDLGLALARDGTGGRLALEGARLWTRATDLISLRQNSQRTYVAENIDRARISGWELHALAERRGVARLDVAATWLTAVDEGPFPYWRGRQLPGRPEAELHGELSMEALPLAPTLAVLHLAQNFRDRENSAAGLIPARTLWSLSVARAFPAAHLSARLSLDNLADRRVSDVFGYPLPGRSASAGLTWTLPAHHHPGAAGKELRP